ncbi:MAG: hypothetical protein WAW13_03190 [Minisyncoccia bacterium]
MKKPILITSLIVTILIVLGIWIYLLLFGAPKSTADVFARFGIGGEQEVIPVAAEDTRIDVATSTEMGVIQKLRQLTTRPVAGAAFDEEGIRYIEQGTGHMYHIDLRSGGEILMSGTTIPHTTNALFSKDASSVLVTSGGVSGDNTIVGKVTTDAATGGTIEGVSLPQGAREIMFGVATNTVNYILDTETGSAGYSYNTIKKTSLQLFTSPLRDIRILWGTPLYAYTTPTATQEGYLYKVIDNELVYTTSGGQGLMGIRYADGVLVTKTSAGKTSSIVHTNSGEESNQAFPFIPEKCVTNPLKDDTVFCATPRNRAQEMFPDDWYKGVISYSDLLWSLTISTGQATPLSDFKADSGREIDVIKIGTDAEGKNIWFINKNDNTLWMFDATM